MTDLIKIMHCWCTYNINGSWWWTNITEEIFWDWSDWNCTIAYNANTLWNVFMEAKEYNFCNLTIDSWVKLRFCWNWVPVLRVKNCFVNNWDILLRNPLISSTVSYEVPYLWKSIRTRCNNLYNDALSWVDALTEDNLKYCRIASWWKYEVSAGCRRCMSQWWDWWNLCTCASPSSGTQYIAAWGSSSYANASWWWGWWYHYDACEPSTVYRWCNWCDAPSDWVWWDWGWGYHNWWWGWFWYCQWGNWWGTNGCSCWNWWAWGNSIIWNWGNWWNWDCPWNWWCSIYGNWWDSWDYSCYSRMCCYTRWWASIYGNWWTWSFCWWISLFWKWWDWCCRAWIWLEWWIWCFSRVWWWVHWLWLFAKDLNNQWMINWKWWDTCSWYSCRCKWSDWAEVYMVYENLTNLWNICVREWYWSTNWYSWFVCMYQI